MALTDGLTAYWKLDEASGTRSDAVGSCHLTDHNTVTSAAGKRGTAAQFTAANAEYLWCADAPAISLTSAGEWTIAVWVYADSFPNGGNSILTKGGAGEYFLDVTSGGTLRLFINGGGPIVTATLTTGAWHLIVVRYQGTAPYYTLTVDDGSPVTGGFTSLPDGTGELWIGGRQDVGDGNTWDGRIDEAGIWNARRLSDAEVAELYDGGAGWTYTPPPPPLEAGSVAEASHNDHRVTLTFAGATGGAGAVTDQVQRSPAGAGSWADVTGGTASPVTDTGLDPSTAYDYRLRSTDGIDTVDSSTVTVTTDAAPPEPAWLDGWSHRRAVVLAAAGGEQNHADLNADLLLGPDDFGVSFATCRADGADLRVADRDGTTLLPFVLHWFDPAAELGLLTVRLPEIDATDPRTVYLYYGDPEAAAASSFDTALTIAPGLGEMLAAWDFAEGAGATAADLTGNGHALSLVNAPAWMDASTCGYGQLAEAVFSAAAPGGRLAFASASNRRAVCATSLLQSPPAAGTIGCWVTFDALTDGGRVLSMLSTDSDVDAGDNGVAVWVNADGTLTATKTKDGPSDFASITSLRTPIEAGATHHVMVSWGPRGFELWIDGHIEKARPDKTTAWTAGTRHGLTFAARGGGSFHADVTIDAAFVLDRQPTGMDVVAALLRRKYLAGHHATQRSKLDRQAVIAPTLAAEADNALEPNVLDLRDAAPGAFVAFYTAGPNPVSGLFGVFRATSADGRTGWSKSAAAVIGDGAGGLAGDAARPWVLRSGSTLHAWAADQISSVAADLWHFTSSDWGVTWTKDASPAVARDAIAGMNGAANPFVAEMPGGTYRLNLEYFATVDPVWRLAAWSSPSLDGPWTPLQTLPTVQVGVGTYSALRWFEVGSVYYGYSHGSARTDDGLPTEIYSHVSTDGLTWFPRYGDVSVVGMQEFADLGNQDQTADCCPLILADEVRLYHDYDSNFGTVYSRIGLASFAGSAAEFVADGPAMDLGDEEAGVLPDPTAAGAASFVSSGPGGITVSATAPTGGTGTLSYQWERNEDGGAYADLSGATSLDLTDATATPGVLYGYRCKQTRGVETVTTDAVTAQVYAGGPLGASGEIDDVTAQEIIDEVLAGIAVAHGSGSYVRNTEPLDATATQTAAAAALTAYAPATAFELAKVPKVGRTTRHRNVVSDETADVTIEEAD